MTGREWKGAVASLLLHGSLVAGALALSGAAHDADTAIVIDFSLLPSRDVPGENPGGAAAPPVEAERPAANKPVVEEPRAAVKPPLPVKDRVPSPREPTPLLQEETETAAPVLITEEPDETAVADIPEEPEFVMAEEPAEPAPPSDPREESPPPGREPETGAAEALPGNDRAGPLGAASGEESFSPPGAIDGGHSLLTEGPSEAAGVGKGSLGGAPDSQRDFSFIREKVQRNTRYPRLARQMGLEGQVKVSFVVCLDGHVMDIKVLESSGVSLLDKCAVDAVRKTSPFPSQQLEAKVIIPIVYRLNDQ